MANTQEVCISFKKEILTAIHALGTTVARGTGADALKMALYLASAARDKDDTIYDTTGEVTGNNYVAGGVAVVNANPPSNTNDKAHWTPSQSVTYTNVDLNTADFDAALLYNSTQGDKAIAVFTFSPQQVTAGDFVLTMPIDDDVTGLLRIA
jgi:hypothetical protein